MTNFNWQDFLDEFAQTIDPLDIDYDRHGNLWLPYSLDRWVWLAEHHPHGDRLNVTYYRNSHLRLIEFLDMNEGENYDSKVENLTFKYRLTWGKTEHLVEYDTEVSTSNSDPDWVMVNDLYGSTPLYVIKAPTWEEAYNRAVQLCPEVNESDLHMFHDKNGNLMSARYKDCAETTGVVDISTLHVLFHSNGI